MESDGLIRRESFREIPPRVEYTLTEKGAAALPVIDALRTFGDTWLTDAEKECC
jgi:DNA-binding HxlR family transcriptional regulator